MKAADDGQDKAKKITGRYRKVEVRTWGDEKFRRLSQMPPCGQGLWLFLITGPHTGPIPGLFRAGRAAMAEELGWEIEAFDEAFGEAFREGMVKADFKARVIWLPSAIKHNRPESPNVVRSWAAEFDLIPECDLKREAFEALKASIHALGEAFGKAFDEAFAKPLPKPSPKPSPKAMPNQEQEQEQEQEYSEAKASGAFAPPAILPKENPGPMSEKDRVWALGESVLAAGDARWRTKLGRLVSTHGEGCVLEGLQATAAEQPGDPYSWLVKACETRAKAQPRGRGQLAKGEPVDLLADPCPRWAVEAGFANRFEAENSLCFAHNAHQFRDGQRA